ncbi:hypothetical protein BGX27_003185 [Mortierella sp. AM989]|nr:hypothetical protein BGX27_003185 [Mortierella sp. AM989]
MFWKKDSADSTVPLQDVPSPHARRQYEALQNIDPQDAEKCASKPAVSSAAQRRFFSPNNIVTSRTKAVIATGKIEPSFRPNHDLGIEIPEATSAFKLTANFSNYSAGLYNIRWRVKLLESLKISNGLHFSVNVSYDVRWRPDIAD